MDALGKALFTLLARDGTVATAMAVLSFTWPVVGVVLLTSARGDQRRLVRLDLRTPKGELARQCLALRSGRAAADPRKAVRRGHRGSTGSGGSTAVPPTPSIGGVRVRMARPRP